MATKSRQNPAKARSFQPREENISIQTFEDQATEIDRLGFEPYVKAIAKFLTNEDTKPPLVLSIEGEWGSGKSSFMLQLKQAFAGSNPPIVWFDPWRYDKEEELWAVFASDFVEQIIQNTPLAQRSVKHIRRFVRRFQWREGWFDLAIKTLTWIGLLIILVAIGQNAYLFGDQWVQAAYQWLSNDKTNLSKTFIETGIQVGGVTGFLILSIFLLGKLMPIIEDPLKMDLHKYISSPSYKDRVPFIRRFQKDFQETLDIYVGQQKVFVFVDDLDRCEVPKAADVMSAINLMIGNDSRVVFIIAMDREKVAAGLAVKYEKILPYILASRTYNLSTFSNHELVGLEFGYEFIEKFVQLPFRIPQPDISKIDNLLSELQQDKDEKVTRPPARRTRFKENFKLFSQVFRRSPGDTSAKGEGEGNEQHVELVDPGKPEEGGDSAKNKQRESIIIQIGPETDTFISIVKTVAIAFDYNPRRIKQFINLFRLRVYIAAETGLFDEDPNSEDSQPLTIEKVAKLTALELRWPIFVADLQGDANILTDLQQLAYGHELPEISSRVELWQARQDLMSFLKIGDPALAPGADAARNLWDLTGINLVRLLQVSPKVHELAAFVPGTPEPQREPELPRENVFEVLVANPNPDPGQPAQYITVDGRVKHNLAGEFCAAFIGKDSIEGFLEKWKKYSPTHYAVAVEKDQPTSIEIVENMLGVYGYWADKGDILPFEKGLDGSAKGSTLTPSQLARMSETYYLIVGAFIDRRSYRLAGGGILVWVVLDRAVQEENEMRVEIYHPYPNQRQEYTYKEFIKSMGGTPTGLWVRKKIVR